MKKNALDVETDNFYEESIAAPAAYAPAGRITGASLTEQAHKAGHTDVDLGNFQYPTDIFYDEDNKLIYMLDSLSSLSEEDDVCRLIVLNTASIQLIPATVAAVRASLGCASPFDILPAVWITSTCSVGLGLAAAWLLGKVWKT